MDVITQFVMIGAAHLLLATALPFFRPPPELRDCVRLWLAAQLLIGFGVMLFIGRRSGSLFWFSTLPNTLLQLGLGVTLLAAARLTAYPQRWLIPVIALGVVLQLLLREFGLPENYRLAFVVLTIAATQCLLPYIYARHWSQGSRLLRYLVVGNVLIVATYFWRFFEALTGGANYHFFNAGPAQLVGVFGFYANALLNGFGFLMLLSEYSNRELRRLSTLDPLTETLNRRSLIETAQQQFALADRQFFPVSVMMADLDHFKQINDRFGHQSGDQALQRFVAVVREQMRASDSIGRWGGEEFVLLLPRTGIDGALQLARRINENFSRQQLVGTAENIYGSVSLGVAEHQRGEDILTTIARADRALYRAKHLGRNRVELAEPALS